MPAAACSGIGQFVRRSGSCSTRRHQSPLTSGNRVSSNPASTPLSSCHAWSLHRLRLLWFRLSKMQNRFRQPRYSKLAELEFEHFCGQIDAVCNRVSDDQTGWDFIVEFRPDDDPEVPPDLRPAPRRAFVQIKHSTSESNVCELKLSNALRYAEDEQPWFVIFFSYDEGSSKPGNVYVKHIWTSEMGTILRESRRAHVLGKKLNRTNIRLKFLKPEQCAENPLLRILGILEQTGPAYGQQKAQLARGLGYDSDVAATGTFTLAEGVTLQEFVSLQLGLIDSLPIERFTFVDQRFNIPIPRREMGPGRISIAPRPVRECVVSILNAHTGTEVSWPGQIYVPVIPGLDQALRRMRVVAGPLEIVIAGDGTANFKWSMPVNEPQNIVELSRQISFRSWSDSHPLDMAIWSEGQCLTAGNLNFDGAPANEPYWKTVHHAFGTLLSIAPIERVPTTLMLSLGELLDHINDLSEFAAHLSQGQALVTMTLEQPSTEDLDDTTHMIIPVHYELAGHVFIAVVERRVTEIAFDGRTIKLQTDGARILRGAVLQGSAEDHRAFVAREVEWADKRARNSERRTISYHPNLRDDGAP